LPVEVRLWDCHTWINRYTFECHEFDHLTLCKCCAPVNTYFQRQVLLAFRIREATVRFFDPAEAGGRMACVLNDLQFIWRSQAQALKSKAHGLGGSPINLWNRTWSFFPSSMRRTPSLPRKWKFLGFRWYCNESCHQASAVKYVDRYTSGWNWRYHKAFPFLILILYFSCLNHGYN